MGKGYFALHIFYFVSYKFVSKLKITVVTENQITEQIIDASIKIHKALGPGLLESVYEACLYSDISTKGLFVERQKPIP